MRKSKYKQHSKFLRLWKEGKKEIVGFRVCKLEGCNVTFPIFLKKSDIPCCCVEHGHEYRKERAAISKQKSKSGSKDYIKRPPWVLTLCKNEHSGECSQYAKGFDLDNVNAGCWGWKYHKDDGSCYKQESNLSTQNGLNR